MKHRSFLFPFLIFCLTLLLALPVFANAAEPPCLTVVVVDAPQDLELALVHDDGEEAFQLVKRQMTRGWETYFRFTYSHVILPGMTDALDGFDLSALRLSVTADGKTTALALPADAFAVYNNVLQLDVSDMSLQTELYPGRMVLIIGLRVLMTFLVEGAIFFLFGYREKHSWGIFLCFNAMTQLGLNLVLGGASMDSYVLFGYYLLELLIVIFEMAAFHFTLQEKRGRSIIYAACANLASLMIGAWMIENLPLPI